MADTSGNSPPSSGGKVGSEAKKWTPAFSRTAIPAVAPALEMTNAVYMQTFLRRRGRNQQAAVARGNVSCLPRPNAASGGRLRLIFDSSSRLQRLADRLDSDDAGGNRRDRGLRDPHTEALERGGRDQALAADIGVVGVQHNHVRQRIDRKRRLSGRARQLPLDL